MAHPSCHPSITALIDRQTLLRMLLSNNGPFDRSTHVPSICKSCACSEFLAVEPSEHSTYTGFEKCLACPHRARQHIWNPIKPRVRCVCKGFVFGMLTPTRLRNILRRPRATQAIMWPRASAMVRPRI